jgi:hypothetical protein
MLLLSTAESLNGTRDRRDATLFDAVCRPRPG